METRMTTTNRTRALTLGLALLAASLVVLLLALVTTKPAQAAFPGKNGKIVYVSNVDNPSNGEGDIFTMNPDGTGVRQLTKNDAFDLYPQWSPDGTRIAYMSLANGGGIFTMKPDGSGVRKVTSDTGDELAWSPDGKRIAYVKLTNGNQRDIFTVRFDGTGKKQVTSTSAVSEQHPDWSPDGTKIAYSRLVDGKPADIFTIAAGGGSATRITTNMYAVTPDWSPDGKRIAFNGSGNRLYDVPAQGGASRELVGSVNWPGNPAYSPDGTKIAYYGDNGTRDGIFIVSSQGGTGTPVKTSNTWETWYASPDWQPTGVPAIDYSAPKGTIKINGGKAYTKSRSVKLRLSASDSGSGVAHMSLKNDGRSWTPWMRYTSSKDWTLRKANGNRTVYVRYRDKAGNVSTTALDRIRLDMKRPYIGNVSPKRVTKDRTPTIKATVKDNMTNLKKRHIKKLVVNGKKVPKRKFRYSSSRNKLVYAVRPKLPKGKRVKVKIVVRDQAGNHTVKGWRFKIR